jgi:hypothetical protein
VEGKRGKVGVDVGGELNVKREKNMRDRERHKH